MKPRIIFLSGPTAVGKSAIAVILAKKINAEIISCDSMQVYKGMDIVASLPSPSLRRQVRHHLVGFYSPKKEYSVWQYRRQATAKIKEILHKGKTPLFVGGSGLYMSVMVDGIFEINAQDERLRQRLAEQIKKEGPFVLYQQLKEIDPPAAGKIHPHDTRRIIRAWEVYLLTGKPISYWQQRRQGLSQAYRLRMFCLNLPRHILDARIKQRIEEMFERGVVKEVEDLLKGGLSKTAGLAIGIPQIKAYLAGEVSLAETKEAIFKSTRLYSRRQLTWFRKDKRLEWINLEGNESPQEAAEIIWKKLSW